jgi:hypothetical protein
MLSRRDKSRVTPESSTSRLGAAPTTARALRQPHSPIAASVSCSSTRLFSTPTPRCKSETPPAIGWRRRGHSFIDGDRAAFFPTSRTRTYPTGRRPITARTTNASPVSRRATTPTRSFTSTSRSRPLDHDQTCHQAPSPWRRARPCCWLEQTAAAFSGVREPRTQRPGGRSPLARGFRPGPSRSPHPRPRTDAGRSGPGRRPPGC